MFSVTIVVVPLVFLFLMFSLQKRIEDIIQSNCTNITILPTLKYYSKSKYAFEDRRENKSIWYRRGKIRNLNKTLIELNTLMNFNILKRIRREGKKGRKLSRKDRKMSIKYKLTTTEGTTRLTSRLTKSPRTTLDIDSQYYDEKKQFWDPTQNPAEYAYQCRMEASAEAKELLVNYIRKGFFNLTKTRREFSPLELLKNQSRVLYDRYMLIINKSTTINYWRLLRNARYNNTKPLTEDWLKTLDKLYESFHIEGGTASTALYTVDPNDLNLYKAEVKRMMDKIGTRKAYYEGIMDSNLDHKN